MHILAMLVLVILGYAAGENVSWLLGLPIICLGLYMFDVGGRKGSAWRFKQESLASALGLLALAFVVVGSLFNW